MQMQDAMKRHLKHTLLFDFFSFYSSQVTFIKQNLGRPTCIYLVIITYHNTVFIWNALKKYV